VQPSEVPHQQVAHCLAPTRWLLHRRHCPASWRSGSAFRFLLCATLVSMPLSIVKQQVPHPYAANSGGHMAAFSGDGQQAGNEDMRAQVFGVCLSLQLWRWCRWPGCQGCSGQRCQDRRLAEDSPARRPFPDPGSQGQLHTWLSALHWVHTSPAVLWSGGLGEWSMELLCASFACAKR
jgi:hypothetical protein